MAVALDSSAVIGFLDGDDPFHSAAVPIVREALAETQVVVSAVTYAEVLAGSLTGHQELSLVQGFFQDLITVIIPVDTAVAQAGAQIRTESGMRMPDALILATAHLASEVDLLVTGDAGLAAGASELDVETHLLAAAK